MNSALRTVLLEVIASTFIISVSGVYVKLAKKEWSHFFNIENTL